MRYLNTKSKRRRGLAIELALLVMILLSAFSILIVNTALLQNSHKTANDTKFKERITLSEIGEDFCSAVKNGEDMITWQESVTSFNAIANKSTSFDGTLGATLTLYDHEGTLLMSVALSAKPTEPYKITEWTYHR